MESVETDLFLQDLLHDLKLLVHSLRAGLSCQIVELVLFSRLGMLVLDGQVGGLYLNTTIGIVKSWNPHHTFVKCLLYLPSVGALGITSLCHIA